MPLRWRVGPEGPRCLLWVYYTTNGPECKVLRRVTGNNAGTEGFAPYFTENLQVSGRRGGSRPALFASGLDEDDGLYSSASTKRA